MRLPNGTGGISKLPGNRRNPWRARVTKAWIVNEETQKATQQFLTIGYYPSRKAALQALMKYHQNPYDISVNTITFEELYEKWSEQHFPTITRSASRTLISAYNHSAPLHKMRFKDIRPNHMEKTILASGMSSSMKARMKSLYNLLFRYAIKMDIVEKDYARLCDNIPQEPPKIIRTPFSMEEIAVLKDNLCFPFVDMVLIGIYTGWRPQELSTLKCSNINLDKQTICGGMKTDAGKNRVIPIHPAIRGLIIKRLEHAESMKSNFLFNDEYGQQGTYMTYDKYRGRFKKIMQRFHLEHKPHDTRHTFISLAKQYEMNEYILKMIVGHTIQDLTEKVYTHRSFEQVIAEMNKIPDFLH